MTRPSPDDSSTTRLASDQAEPTARSWLGRFGYPAVLVALTGLYLVPIWAYPYFPSTDGPSHLGNAWVLRNWFAEPGIYQDTYQLNLSPFPNWFSHVTLALRRTGRRGILSIRDDGVGFRPGDPQGLGLHGIRERVEVSGGTVRITSAHGRGTQITVEVPVDGNPDSSR